MRTITFAALLASAAFLQLAPRADANMPPPPVPVPAKCTPLKWDGDKMNAAEASFEGKVGAVVGEDAAGRKEPFWVVTLTTPVCDPEGQPVPEVQVFSSGDLKVAIDFAKVEGKKVTVTGTSFTEMTAHHHRPIVVEAIKLVVAK